MKDIRKHIQYLLNSMGNGAFEREEAIALSLLTAIAGESIFLLGLPGVGKSMIARRLKLAFKGARSFEYLMSRFSTPDEIFGPVSITKLKDEDTYERVVEGYLPTADVVFLDEIWKAGPAIQNSLLTALNERIYHNGKQDMRLPLKTIISASNELPAEGEGLEALWDRFLIRYVVRPIRTRTNFLSLLNDDIQECCVPESLKIDDAWLSDLQRKARHIRLSSAAEEIICELHDTFNNEDKASGYMPDAGTTPYVSDRRWRKITGILRMSALLNGRDEVDLSDCFLMEHMLWNDDSQIDGINKLIAETIVRPLEIDDDDWMSEDLAEPVGNPVSPDGEHYTFEAGGEEVLVGIDQYDSIPDDGCYGSIDNRNVLHLTREEGMFRVKKGKRGTIILNAFTYNLRRSTPLKSGKASDIRDLYREFNKKGNSSLYNLIKDNIFLSAPSVLSRIDDTFDRLDFLKNNKC